MPVNNAINKVITEVPTAGAVPLWDTNANLSASNLLNGFQTRARVNFTQYVLTVASPGFQQFTGSGAGDEVLMPLTSTLALGQTFTLLNSSSGSLNIRDSTDTNTIYANLPAGFAVVLVCILQSGATAASWYIATVVRPVVEGTFTSTFTFSTVGDLSVSYSTQTGIYRQFPTPTGSMVWMYGILSCTPTYTTAGNQPRIVATGAPGNISPSNSILIMPVAQGINFGAGNTYAFLQGAGSSDIFTLCAQGTTKTAGTAFNMTAAANFTSGTALQLYWEGWYRSG